MVHVVYRKKGLYYKKYGYKIDCWSDHDGVHTYVRDNFKENDYRIIVYQGIYFKNESDFEKTCKKFNKGNVRLIHRPAPGYENYINTVENVSLWHNRFPFRIKLDTRYKSHSNRHKIFNKMSRWCITNLDGPYHASFPSIFVMTKLDVVAIKLRFSDHVEITDQRVDNKKSIKLLKHRIDAAKNDLKLFLSGE